MAKRASSGLSLVVGVDKPAGMTSHDVVDAVRRIYGERRVGHAGTLDPDATGALLVCVGPAARLDRFLSGQRKSYVFDIVFGTQTDTDDASGQVVRRMPVPRTLCDEGFARQWASRMVGTHQQLPPAYSAISKDGVRAYEAARKGRIIELDPRPVHIADCQLLGVSLDQDANPVWTLAAQVSAGTYIRSLARDAGLNLGTCAHVGALRRTATGNLTLAHCATLQQLQAQPFSALLDPVKLLGFRVMFADGASARAVANGNPLAADTSQLASYPRGVLDGEGDACASGLQPCDAPLADGECVCVVVGKLLAAIYAFDAASGMLKSSCGFATGVRRGPDL